MAAVDRPAFAVVPAPTGTALEITRAETVPRVPVDAIRAIDVGIRVSGARGRTLVVSLREGSVTVDRVTQEIGADVARHHATLRHAAHAAGTTTLAIAAEIEGSPLVARADVAVESTRDRRAVLFVERRPSWMSTFARRAVEADPRLEVTSRVSTSREVGIDQGRPPESLRDPMALAPFDAVVVGAPEELSSRDVDGLAAFMRRRGGSVVLLLDRSPDGAPFQRLAGGGRWATSDRDEPSTLQNAFEGSLEIQASELAWPAELPPGATPLVSRPDGAAILWQAPVGLGRLIVSGALDAWRFRGADQAGFDRFFQSIIGEAALAAAPPLDVIVHPTLAMPFEPVTIRARLRGAAAEAAALTASMGDRPVTLWPNGAPGEYVGTVRAPAAPGPHAVRARASDGEASTSMIVATRVERPTEPARSVLTQWIAARGGAVIDDSRLTELGPALDRVLDAAIRPVEWHPMRSGWWMVPFALAAGGEWWLRRRAGKR
jgi:hypothetical protein